MTDEDGARADGAVFGRAIGRSTAAEMTRAGQAADQAAMIGAEGVSAILARADALADAGLDRDQVAAWTEAAAEAFHAEMAAAAALLTTPAPTSVTH